MICLQSTFVQSTTFDLFYIAFRFLMFNLFIPQCYAYVM